MPGKAETKPIKKKEVALLKKMIADKTAIQKTIEEGGDLSALKAKGIRFVKPL